MVLTPRNRDIELPLTETLQVTLEIAAIFERLKIDYLVGGSVASSLHGIPRATQDVDMLARMTSRNVQPFIKALEDKYYAAESAITDAISRGGSFNIIHLDSMFKIDVFVCTGEDLLVEEMSRAKRLVVSEETGQTLVVADAADIVIQKLLWYEQGERVSDRQWNDVVGVLKVCGGDIDMVYLKKWAAAKGLTALLTKAIDESS